MEMVVADVKTSEALDKLIVTPRDTEDLYAISKALKDALPGVRIHKAAYGVWVSAHDAHRLLSCGLDGLDLRWAQEARLFAKNRLLARQKYVGLLCHMRDIRSGGPGLARDTLSGVAGIDVLDDHQAVNVALMTLRDGCGMCIFDEQGAGKTVTLIFAFDALVSMDLVDFALVVAPKSMVPEWRNDFLKFKGDLYKVELLTGTLRQKRGVIGKNADVLITNFETTVSMESELRALLRRYGGRAVLVVDESFFVKNMDARRTAAIRRLRELCGRAFVLCGTPAPNSPHDLIQQFNIVDFGIAFDGIIIPEGREEAKHVIQRIIEERGLYIRHLKSDVMPGLPAKRFNRVYIELQPQQKKLYETTLNELVSDLSGTTEESFQRHIVSFLARRSALLQICSNPCAVAEGYDEIPAKLIAMDNIFEELIEKRGEKVVLWSFYTASIDAIMQRYEWYGPVRYDGTVTDVEERRKAVQAFQDNNHTMLFVGNPAAAGAGLTLHRSRFAVYESMSNQAAHYLQSLDRIHRRGQTRDVEYLVILCDRTIELGEYQRLLEKERSAQDLLGDRTEAPVTRDTMLSEMVDAVRRIGEGYPYFKPEVQNQWEID